MMSACVVDGNAFAAHMRQTQSGSTALILAAANGRADCVRLILDVGADNEAMQDVREICFVIFCNDTSIVLFCAFCLSIRVPFAVRIKVKSVILF